MSRRLPVVAVVGRPNVGKSTFFNRVLGKRIAIVDDTPGVTRDRNFSRADWAGRDFYLVDTGGVIEDSDEPMDRAIREQALAAVEEADVILMLVDGKVGVHPLDEKLSEVLRKADKPVLLVVNKMDNLPTDQGHLDFWSLGMGEPHPVSSISGKGSGNLLDVVNANLPDADELEDEEGVIRIAVVGKPNVGKSSFVNRLFGEERSVVSEIPGTTRDPIDSTMKYHGLDLIFVDTAGLRRQSRVKDSLEYYSALRTSRVVIEADVCIVLIDATDDVTHQDLRIIEQAWEASCSVILVANKWDLVSKETMTAPNFSKTLNARVPDTKWVPIVFTSALTGQRVRKILELVVETFESRSRRIPTSEVNEVLERIVAKQQPPHSRGRWVKLKYGTQISTAPPEFLIFSNLPKEVPANYVRFIYNTFREKWGFVGSPIRIRLKQTKRESKKEGRHA
jgi:GTP-binding protein